MANKQKKERPKKPPGPEPQRLKLKGDWEELVKKALAKKPEGKNPPKP